MDEDQTIILLHLSDINQTMPLSVQEKVQLVEAIKKLDPSFSLENLGQRRRASWQAADEEFNGTKRMNQNMVELLGRLAPFRGEGDQSPSAWINRVENFLRTFRLTPEAIEPYIATYLLDSGARRAYYTLLDSIHGINRLEQFQEFERGLSETNHQLVSYDPKADPNRKSVDQSGIGIGQNATDKGDFDRSEFDGNEPSMTDCNLETSHRTGNYNTDPYNKFQAENTPIAETNNIQYENDSLNKGGLESKESSYEDNLSNIQNKKYLSWEETCNLIRPLDKPITRSILQHKKLQKLADNDELSDHLARVVAFSVIERDLDPAPLGDRLYWLFKICPWSEAETMRYILDKQETNDGGQLDLDSVLQWLENRVRNQEQGMTQVEEQFQASERDESPQVNAEIISSKVATNSNGTDSSTNSSSSDTSPQPGPYKERRAHKNKERPCSYCHKLGHRAAHCYRRRKEMRGPESKSRDNNK